MKREKRSGRAARVKLGSTGVALAALVALVVVALFAAWLTARAPSTAGSTGPQVGPSTPASNARSGDTPLHAERAVVQPETNSRAPEDPDRFRGRGRIRGEVLADGGLALPQRWTLVVEPDPNLVGSESAERREVVHEQGEKQFDVRDLPLGGYRVSIVAAGLNSTRTSVLLVRSSSSVFVSLRLARAGLVDGFVLDDMGRAAEGLGVTIENRRTRERATAVVDATGAFTVADIVDGEYTITFGSPEAPLVEPGTFTFRAPTLRWRETKLPPTGTARIEVQDARGERVIDATVEGSGSPKGLVRGVTGGDGALVAHFLLPGRYEVRARAPDGRVGRAEVEVVAGTRADAVIVVQ